MPPYCSSKVIQMSRSFRRHSKLSEKHHWHHVFSLTVHCSLSLLWWFSWSVGLLPAPKAQVFRYYELLLVSPCTLAEAPDRVCMCAPECGSHIRSYRLQWTVRLKSSVETFYGFTFVDRITSPDLSMAQGWVDDTNFGGNYPFKYNLFISGWLWKYKRHLFCQSGKCSLLWWGTHLLSLDHLWPTGRWLLMRFQFSSA